MATLSLIPSCEAAPITCASGTVPSARTAPLAALITTSIGCGRGATCPIWWPPSPVFRAWRPLFGVGNFACLACWPDALGVAFGDGPGLL
eukprot:1260509-Lingulodinium_polyedra.AAC.1